MKKSIYMPKLLLLCGCLWFSAVQAEPVAPEELVKETTDKILQALKDNTNNIDENRSAVFKLVDEIVLPHFDFARMSKLVLAKYWRTASTVQRESFVAEFRALIVRTYATALLDYTDEKVHFLSSLGDITKRRVTVRTEIKKPGSSMHIPIYYEMYLPKDSWKVYDVKVDNVSLVTTYRGAYKERIKREGLDKLIDSLKKKSEDSLKEEK